MLASGKDFSMRELQESGSTHTLPYCIEPALGLDRLMLALLSATYTEEEVLSADGQPTTRSLFRLPVDLAPIQMAVLPLSKKEVSLFLPLPVFIVVHLWHHALMLCGVYMYICGVCSNFREFVHMCACIVSGVWLMT